MEPPPSIARSDDALANSPLHRSWPRTLALSFFATVVGWLVASAVLLASFALRGDRPSDWSDGIIAIAGLVGIHCATAWVLAVVPLALATPQNSPVHGLRFAPLFGACWGALLLVIALSFWGLPNSLTDWVLLPPAVACGAVTWTLFSVLQRAAARSDGVRAAS